METIQTQKTANNLDLYSTLFMVKGVLTSLFAIFPLLYIFLGSFFGTAIAANEVNDMPFNPGVIFVVLGVVGFLCVITLAILTFIASTHLKKRTAYKFVFAVAIINCLTGVLGILLGVFTLVELNKPEVKALFDQAPEA